MVAVPASSVHVPVMALGLVVEAASRALSVMSNYAPFLPWIVRVPCIEIARGKGDECAPS